MFHVLLDSLHSGQLDILDKSEALTFERRLKLLKQLSWNHSEQVSHMRTPDVDKLVIFREHCITWITFPIC